MHNFLTFYILYLITYFGSSYTCYAWDINSVYKKRQPTDVEKLKAIYAKILPTVLFNVCIVTPIFTMGVFSLFTISDNFSVYYLPSDLFFIITGTEILFYTLHRVAHHPKIYAKIHKKHHELTAPVGLGALYCHPLEMVLVNLPPVVLPGLILGVSYTSIMIYGILATFNTVVESHGGYKMSTCNNNACRAFHDIHHEKFNGNFGLGYFMDGLFKTIIW